MWSSNSDGCFSCNSGKYHQCCSISGANFITSFMQLSMNGVLENISLLNFPPAPSSTCTKAILTHFITYWGGALRHFMLWWVTFTLRPGEFSSLQLSPIYINKLSQCHEVWISVGPNCRIRHWCHWRLISLKNVVPLARVHLYPSNSFLLSLRYVIWHCLEAMPWTMAFYSTLYMSYYVHCSGSLADTLSENITHFLSNMSEIQ